MSECTLRITGCLQNSLASGSPSGNVHRLPGLSQRSAEQLLWALLRCVGFRFGLTGTRRMKFAVHSRSQSRKTSKASSGSIVDCADAVRR